MKERNGSNHRDRERHPGESVGADAQAAGHFACSSSGPRQEEQGGGQAPTEHSIRAYSDDEVALSLWEYASYWINRERPRKWEEVVPSFPVGLRTVYMVFSVQREVYNGGFEQLFWNHGVQIAPYAAEALQRVGLHEAANIVLAAKQLHEAEMARNPEYATQEYPGSYGFEDIESLDLQYCAAADEADVYYRLLAYIRANPTSCIPSEG